MLRGPGYYFVRAGDSLTSIATRFGTTVHALRASNLVCDPDLILPEQFLIIPQPGLNLPQAGAGPYYSVMPRDTLWCLAHELDVAISILAQNNNIVDADLIMEGQELLTLTERPDPEKLAEDWRALGGFNCEDITPAAIHAIHYQGSFAWQALGENALPPLLDLLKHPCGVVRVHSAVALGRIGACQEALPALADLGGDPDPAVRRSARLAARRFHLVKEQGARIHVLVADAPLHREPSLCSDFATVREGTGVMVERWFIPSPTGEQAGGADLQIYDLVRVHPSGEIGFLARAGSGETRLI